MWYIFSTFIVSNWIMSVSLFTQSKESFFSHNNNFKKHKKWTRQIMQQKHFFCNKEEKNKKKFRERSKDYIQLNSHSSKVSYVHKRIKKHWQRVIIPHIFTKETYLLSPSTAVNTIHAKKEQSHEIHLAFIDIHGQNARFLKISVAPPNLQNVYKIFAVIRK